jgi:PAS domain S-box-containing protein
MVLRSPRSFDALTMSTAIPSPSRLYDPPVGWPAAERLEFLAKLARWTTQVSPADLSQVLTQIVEAACRLTGAEEGTVLLFDYSSDELYVAAGCGGEATDVQPIRMKVGDVPIAREASRDEILIQDGEVIFAPGRTASSLICVPLLAGASQLGLLCVISQHAQLALEDGDRQLLTALASQAAIAVERCNRKRGSRQSDRWLQAYSDVFKASRVPSTIRDVDDLLEVIAEQAHGVSGADFVVLYEYFEEKKDVRLPPAIAGELWEDKVLKGRGEEIDHKRSAVFRMLERQEPFYAENAADEWRDSGLVDSTAPRGDRSIFAREGVTSSAALPLSIDEERVGVLFINYRTETQFSPDFQNHLELFANQAALAISNARFFLRSERYRENLEVLNDIGRRLSSAVALDFREIGELIERQTRRVIDTTNFFICLFDEDRGQFTLPHHRDKFDKTEGLLSGLHEGLAAYVCRKREPLLVNREEQQRLFAQGHAKLVGAPSAVWLGAPMIAGQKVIGVIVVQDYQDETAFTEEHRHLLSAIASQAAIAIENYRLLWEARQRNEELSALLGFSSAFRSRKLTLTQLLSPILDDLCRIASCEGSLLFLIDSSKEDKLKVFAASRDLQEFVGETVLFGEGVAGRVARQRKHLIINDYDRWEKRSPLFDRAKTGSPRRVCGVPLIWKDTLLGVMTLSSGSEQKFFSNQEVEILQRFAGPAAIAIGNARDSSFRHALIDGGPNAIVATDTRGRIIEFNDAASKIFDYRRDDLLGDQASKLYWRGVDEAKRIRELLSKKDKVNEETFGKTRDGDKIPLSISAALLKDEEGAVLGTVGILEDLRLTALRGRIRQLVKAIEEINGAEDLEQILDLIVINAVTLLFADAGCIFLKDGESFVIKAPNGYDDCDRDNLGNKCVRSKVAEMVALGEPRILSLSDTGGDELRILRLSRSAVLVPIRTEARVLGALLVESRETNHFQADQELLAILASQAAVSINRLQLLTERERTQRGLLVSANAIAVGQIATSFIHETKNALNGMSITVLNLSDDLNREPDLRAKKEYAERLSNIQSEFQRIDDLARRLQRFTQQGLHPHKEEVYFNDVVKKTVQLLSSAFRSKALKPEERFDPSLDSPGPGRGRGNPIVIDESQIQQVLMNLILNAVAASPQRGRLLIETRNQSDQVEFRLTDYGRGISEDERRQLFNPFFTTKKEGVGLGLYISKVLVEENHGGTIEVSSSPGKGATFLVILPT